MVPCAAGVRNPSRQMERAQDWHEGLAAFVAEALRYRGRGNEPGSETNPTNQIYDQFLPIAADLLVALDERCIEQQVRRLGGGRTLDYYITRWRQPHGR